jgi:hypothetical protein
MDVPRLRVPRLLHEAIVHFPLDFCPGPPNDTGTDGELENTQRDAIAAWIADAVAAEPMMAPERLVHSAFNSANLQSLDLLQSVLTPAHFDRAIAHAFAQGHWNVDIDASHESRVRRIVQCLPSALRHLARPTTYVYGLPRSPRNCRAMGWRVLTHVLRVYGTEPQLMFDADVYAVIARALCLDEAAQMLDALWKYGARYASRVDFVRFLMTRGLPPGDDRSQAETESAAGLLPELRAVFSDPRLCEGPVDARAKCARLSLWNEHTGYMTRFLGEGDSSGGEGGTARTTHLEAALLRSIILRTDVDPHVRALLAAGGTSDAVLLCCVVFTGWWTDAVAVRLREIPALGSARAVRLAANATSLPPM